MNNIADIKDCYGCGVCAASCPIKIIDLKLNYDGFYQPVIISPDQCLNCGLCRLVCSYINNINFCKPMECFSAWSNDDSVRYDSTSGGVSFELGKSLLEKGYKFCGVRYNSINNRVEHFIVNSVAELKQTQGSKYLQSYTVKAFQEINKKDKYVVVGTPCQIASFRRYIDKFKCSENFLLVDFYCHGVPSMLAWDKYLKEFVSDIGEISSVSWRNKMRGWHSSYCITVDGESKKYQSWLGKDAFFALFLGDACLGKACYDHCNFKYDKSCADLRIGDFWGDKFIKDKKGICAVVAFTTKGLVLLKESDLVLHKYSFDEVAIGQQRVCAKRPWYYWWTMSILHRNTSSIAYVVPYINATKRISGILNKLISYFK